MLEAIRSPYSKAARAYGVPEYYAYGIYALRNAFLPVLTLTATLFGNLVGGAIVVEFIFAWPGLGFYARQRRRALRLFSAAGFRDPGRLALLGRVPPRRHPVPAHRPSNEDGLMRRTSLETGR